MCDKPKKKDRFHATIQPISRHKMEKDPLLHEMELVSACLRNDPEAQRTLFERHAGKMLAICCRYCQNREDAKDAMHDGFIKVFNQLSKFKGDSKLETWMTRIMINTAIDRFKSSIRFKHYEETEALYRDAGMEHTESYEVDESNLTMEKIYAIIGKLPDGYRVIFNMYAIEGYSHKEIAEKLQISVGTSKSQLARARKQLQQLITESKIIE